ncbi:MULTISPECIES: SMI1/KNR4 family protein [unclassified Brenneria]|uniref:SMI1/KNR4 family protein n=1 Tax=unclassified Brenneria TaxID=2634434 RepID=UPI00155641EF|nr:SMI1/KNR4 family protein [Brenneria sp. hezel4-2-4]MEE3653106.1 SMI1/KNR4 family protein [Brenneria sp. HEZEL_4_2_4]NPD03058.1 SMI1/KNR4 family protein [Brenneria sp. hezel4-2-4]
MGNLFFTDCLPPVTDEEIAELESLIGSALPDEIISLYKRYNGGQPQPSFVHDEKNLYPINSFYSLAEIIDSYNDFDDDALPNDFKKHELLPFAYDPGSGMYSMSLRKSDFGKVYFYVLLEEAEIFGVWSSFKSFLDSIVDDPNP